MIKMELLFSSEIIQIKTDIWNKTPKKRPNKTPYVLQAF